MPCESVVRDVADRPLPRLLATVIGRFAMMAPFESVALIGSVTGALPSGTVVVP